MQKRELYLILLVVIAVQIAGFVVVIQRLPEDNLKTTNEMLAQLMVEVKDLKNKQQRNITTTRGVEINVSKQDIAAAIADAVQNGLATQSSVAKSYNYSAEEPVLSLQGEQTRMASGHEAHGVMDDAIIIGRWTQQDTDALLPYLANLSQEQRNELINKFTEALSNNSIQLNSPPPPL